MTPVEQADACRTAKLFSRVEPAHKSKIVDYIQQDGSVAAMVSVLLSRQSVLFGVFFTNGFVCLTGCIHGSRTHRMSGDIYEPKILHWKSMRDLYFTICVHHKI